MRMVYGRVRCTTADHCLLNWCFCCAGVSLAATVVFPLGHVVAVAARRVVVAPAHDAALVVAVAAVVVLPCVLVLHQSQPISSSAYTVLSGSLQDDPPIFLSLSLPHPGPLFKLSMHLYTIWIEKSRSATNQ